MLKPDMINKRVMDV